MAKTKTLIPANYDPTATVTYNSHLGHSIEITHKGVTLDADAADEILSKLGFCVVEAPEAAKGKAVAVDEKKDTKDKDDEKKDPPKPDAPAAK